MVSSHRFSLSHHCQAVHALEQALMMGWGVNAEYISLLFTDLGVLTPAAVSDELIQLMA